MILMFRLFDVIGRELRAWPIPRDCLEKLDDSALALFTPSFCKLSTLKRIDGDVGSTGFSVLMSATSTSCIGEHGPLFVGI